MTSRASTDMKLWLCIFSFFSWQMKQKWNISSEHLFYCFLVAVNHRLNVSSQYKISSVYIKWLKTRLEMQLDTMAWISNKTRSISLLFCMCRAHRAFQSRLELQNVCHTPNWLVESIHYIKISLNLKCTNLKWTFQFIACTQLRQHVL